jgi:hypothetical protein
MMRPRSHVFAGAAVLIGTALAFCFPRAPETTDGGAVVFSEQLVQDKYGYAYGIAAADLDGDGHLDLVSSDAIGNTLCWFRNDGKGNFTRHVIVKDEPGLLERMAVGDVNGDGKPDVTIIKHTAGDILWFENSGKPAEGPWKRHVVGKFNRPYDVVLADLDGDGLLDVAACSWHPSQIACFRNPGKAEEWTKVLIDDKPGGARTIRAADFNRDGNRDLLATEPGANRVVWYENPGKLGQPWKKHIIDDQSERPMHGHAVDLDGDGDMDVVMALGWWAPRPLPPHQIVWYENVGKPGDGTVWKKHVLGADFPQAFEAVAADLNGDGHLDILATAWGSRPGGQVVWFENPGDPRKVPWKMHVLKENWTNANQVIAADLNGDRRIDVAAVAERGANELRWWRNEGRPKK